MSINRKQAEHLNNFREYAKILELLENSKISRNTYNNQKLAQAVAAIQEQAINELLLALDVPVKVATEAEKPQDTSSELPWVVRMPSPYSMQESMETTKPKSKVDKD
jgi:hypothetical protein